MDDTDLKLATHCDFRFYVADVVTPTHELRHDRRKKFGPEAPRFIPLFVGEEKRRSCAALQKSVISVS
jgi:hypothetical protein